MHEAPTCEIHEVGHSDPECPDCAIRDEYRRTHKSWGAGTSTDEIEDH